MSFANPAADAAAHAPAYVAELLAVLGDRPPTEVLRELPAALDELVAGLDDGLLRRPEAAGKWSVVEVVAHLADTELIYRYRMRRIVATPGGPIEAYDQDAWAGALRYRDADLNASLALIAALRQANLDWLAGLGDEELDRFGMHAERGAESVRFLTRLIAAHDLVHRAQIARIRRALGV